MNWEKLLVDGEETWVEPSETYYAIHIGDDITVGDTVAIVVNCLRAKGYAVEPDPPDDGLMDLWTIEAKYRDGTGSTSMWHRITESEAASYSTYLQNRYPDLFGWCVKHSRITPEDYRRRNDGNFDRKGF